MAQPTLVFVQSGPNKRVRWTTPPAPQQARPNVPLTSTPSYIDEPVMEGGEPAGLRYLPSQPNSLQCGGIDNGSGSVLWNATLTRHTVGLIRLMVLACSVASSDNGYNLYGARSLIDELGCSHYASRCTHSASLGRFLCFSRCHTDKAGKKLYGKLSG